ncbi:MAG: site-specific integrase [Candidatus Latescibacteria bacterium]|nr:site-specific integrase [Candidatus Latescibacterota bacterium]
MGLYKRGTTWWITYTRHGTRIQKPVSRNKQVAELALAKLKLEVERGEHLGPVLHRATFAEFAARYLDYARTNNALTTATRDGYSVTVHLVPFFGTRQMTAITADLVETYKSERLNAVQVATVNTELKVLKHMFRKAVEWQYVRTNPCVTVQKLREPDPPVHYLTQDQITALLIACRDPFAPAFLYPFVVTALNTGLRKSELFYLQWADVDFDHAMLAVRNKDGWHTKNYEARIIPMNALLVQTLRTTPRHPTSPAVFHNPDGTRLHDIRGSFDAAVQRAGLPHTTFHSLRHTFASHLVMNGVDLATVQKLLGHRDIKTTMRYAHLAPEHLKGAVNTLYPGVRDA